jgi:hypothetical protein
MRISYSHKFYQIPNHSHMWVKLLVTFLEIQILKYHVSKNVNARKMLDFDATQSSFR